MNEQNRIGALDYLIVLTKWSRVIVGSFIISCILAFSVGSLVPKWYEANAVIFPPQKQLSNFGLSNFAQNIPFGGFGLFGESQEALIYMAILQSRSVMEAIAKKFEGTISINVNAVINNINKISKIINN